MLEAMKKSLRQSKIKNDSYEKRCYSK